MSECALAHAREGYSRAEATGERGMYVSHEVGGLDVLLIAFCQFGFVVVHLE